MAALSCRGTYEKESGIAALDHSLSFVNRIYMTVLKTILISLTLLGCTVNDERTENIIQRLMATQKFDALLDRIEGGDEELIRNAHLLGKWTDASTSLALTYALSRAAIKKPEAVMGLIPEYFSVSDICTVPYIEESLETELAHIDAALSSLHRSSEAPAGGVYARCIEIYEGLKARMK